MDFILNADFYLIQPPPNMTVRVNII